MIWPFVLLFVAAYLVGGIPFGLIVSRMKGVDIRKQGSGNYGATNVGRVMGRKWGVLVLILDASKGAAASIGAKLFVERNGAAVDPGVLDWTWLGAGLCCVVGNTAPIYLRFKGGKGVATSLGVILGIYPYLTYSALVALVVWLLVVRLSGFVSLASVAAAVTVSLAFIALSIPMDWALRDHLPLLVLAIAAAVVVIYRHRANIGRLLSGTEPRVGQSRKESA